MQVPRPMQAATTCQASSLPVLKVPAASAACPLTPAAFSIEADIQASVPSADLQNLSLLPSNRGKGPDVDGPLMD